MDRARYDAVGGRTRFVSGLLAISVLAALVVLAGEHAAAKRVVGTSGGDRITGTAKADRVNARGGNDRVNGRRGGDRLKGARGKDRIKGAKGKDRLLAGKGRDRLKAVDDKRDRAVNGGAGKDVCTIDQADLRVLKNCEKAKVRNGPGSRSGRRWPAGNERQRPHLRQLASHSARSRSRATALSRRRARCPAAAA